MHPTLAIGTDTTDHTTATHHTHNTNHLLIAGPPHTGKTQLTRALAAQFPCDVRLHVTALPYRAVSTPEEPYGHPLSLANLVFAGADKLGSRDVTIIDDAVRTIGLVAYGSQFDSRLLDVLAATDGPHVIMSNSRPEELSADLLGAFPARAHLGALDPECERVFFGGAPLPHLPDVPGYGLWQSAPSAIVQAVRLAV